MWRTARKVAIAIGGGAVLGFGLALVVLPGPALLVIPVGLAILATEFRWAQRSLGWVREKGRRLARRRG